MAFSFKNNLEKRSLGKLQRRFGLNVRRERQNWQHQIQAGKSARGTELF